MSDSYDLNMTFELFNRRFVGSRDFFTDSCLSLVRASDEFLEPLHGSKIGVPNTDHFVCSLPIEGVQMVFYRTGSITLYGARNQRQADKISELLDLWTGNTGFRYPARCQTASVNFVAVGVSMSHLISVLGCRHLTSKVTRRGGEQLVMALDLENNCHCHHTPSCVKSSSPLIPCQKVKLMFYAKSGSISLHSSSVRALRVVFQTLHHGGVVLRDVVRKRRGV